MGLKKEKIKDRLVSTKLPWDKKEELDGIEKAISDLRKAKYEFYHAKNYEFDNLIYENKMMKTCPYCESTEIIKYGKTSNNLQRYYCKKCNKTFTLATNNLLNNHNISFRSIIDFYIQILSQNSINGAARNCFLDYKNAYRLVSKLFKILQNYQKNIRFTTNLTQMGLITYEYNEKLLRHLRDKCITYRHKTKINICIVTDGKKVFLKSIGYKNNDAYFLSNLKHHFNENLLVTYTNNCECKALINKLNLAGNAVDEKELYSNRKDQNPLLDYLRVKRLLLHFLEVHRGLKSTNIQDYLNLFSFIMNAPENILEKVKVVISCMISTNKEDHMNILTLYRDS